MSTKTKKKKRTRAPGAGRKPLPEGARKVRVTLWMTPAGVAELRAQAGEMNRAQGDHVEEVLRKEREEWEG